MTAEQDRSMDHLHTHPGFPSLRSVDYDNPVIATNPGLSSTPQPQSPSPGSPLHPRRGVPSLRSVDYDNSSVIATTPLFPRLASTAPFERIIL